jgi:hypothetical protein
MVVKVVFLTSFSTLGRSIRPRSISLQRQSDPALIRDGRSCEGEATQGGKRMTPLPYVLSWLGGMCRLVSGPQASRVCIRTRDKLPTAWKDSKQSNTAGRGWNPLDYRQAVRHDRFRALADNRERSETAGRDRHTGRPLVRGRWFSHHLFRLRRFTAVTPQ